MKIREIRVRNFRSLQNVTIRPRDMLSLVGGNNSGKSNVIKALQVFFEASTKTIDEECFYNHHTNSPIEIFLTFNELNDWERDQFGPWMIDESRLIVGRQIICSDGESFSINTIAIKMVPSPEWLREDLMSGERITEWWRSRDDLQVNGLDFGQTLGTSKPTVAAWKEAAGNFINEHGDRIPHEEVIIENPKGYPGVLKGALPEFLYIPAVRDVSEETKVTKSNPFGQLINYVVERISVEHKDLISEQLKGIEKILNRNEGGERIREIDEIESRLKSLMSEVMECDIEIEMVMPKLREVFGGAKIFADDGIRTTIETKGHGMQRSMIFAILRAYIELSSIGSPEGQEAERSTIIAFEEPELYLHPQSQRTLLSVFRDIASGRDQIFYSTHSNLLVDVCYFDDICIMRRTNLGDGFISNPTQLSLQTMLDDLKERKGIDASEEGIREQYYNAFNVMVNEGFFADKVVIVEGPSELYSLPIYCDALGYNLDKNNISVVHTDGKGQMDRLFRIFRNFGIPVYLWFDGDKDNTDPEIKRKTLELLELLEDPIERIEDVRTKIAGAYTVLEHDLEHMMRNEIGDYENLLQQSAELLGPTGKPLKHKYVANVLKKRLEDGGDPVSVLPETVIGIVEKIKELS